MLLTLLLACTRPTDAGSDPAPDPAVVDTASALGDDLDADGVGVADGDCDDARADIGPHIAVDRCDGVDGDCDGEVDEDFDLDPHEPNDLTPTDLGRLRDEDERFVVAYPFPDGDDDVFRFYVPDPDFGFFSVEAWLYAVAPGVDLALDLVWAEDPAGASRGTVASGDEAGPGGVEVLDHGGRVGLDDAGWYELHVRTVSGGRCDAPYTLQILVGGW
jgi:hypothetical protein